MSKFSTAIVTGGSGFIGTHLINRIIQKKNIEIIYNIDLLPSKIDNKKIINIIQNIRNPIELEIDKPAVLFHLAALSKEPGFKDKEYFNTNYFGTLNVIKFAENNFINNIIFTSTMMVYYPTDKRKIESDQVRPYTAYGQSKLFAEKALIAWKDRNHSRYLSIIRPSVVFGKGDVGNYPRLFRLLKANRFVYVGRKSTIKSSVYIHELINFIFFLLKQADNRVLYNFSFPEKLTIEKINNTICDLFNFKKPNLMLPYGILFVLANIFEWLNYFGMLKSEIHHRRIQKLFFSTNIFPKAILDNGYKFNYDFKSSIIHWKNSCDGQDLN